MFSEGRSRLMDGHVLHSAQLAPKRLPNLGNSCYINAVLQGLSHCDLIYFFVKESAHCVRCQLRQNCVRCAFERCVSDLRRPIATVAVSNPAARIVRILPNISMNGSLMTSGEQEDAHEFLSNLLGSLSSSVYCSVCHSVSTMKEPVQGLELEVDRAAALSTALAEYCSTETLAASSGNAYDCAVCRTLTTAQKALRLASVPAVLRIQLKRFRFGSGRCEKLAHVVEYPELLDMSPYVVSPCAEAAQSCDDGAGSAAATTVTAAGDENDRTHANSSTPAKFLSPTGSMCTPTSAPGNSTNTGSSSGKEAGKALHYRLAAVIVHLGGSPESGHYTAYVRCGGAGAGAGAGSSCWYLANDDSVARVSLQEALSQQAYVLLYERTSLLSAHSHAADSAEVSSAAWSSPPPAAPLSARVGDPSSSSGTARREPGRLVSYSNAYYAEAVPDVAVVPASAVSVGVSSSGGGGRSSYFGSSSRAGANPLFCSSRLSMERGPSSLDSISDFGSNSVDSRDSYLTEVKQRAAAAAAGAVVGSKSTAIAATVNAIPEHAPPLSAAPHSSGSGSRGNGGGVDGGRGGAPQPSAVPSRRVFGGYSRRRLFNSLNIFSSSKGKSQREKQLHDLHVLGHKHKQPRGEDRAPVQSGALAGDAACGDAKVDGFFLHSQQQWDTPAGDAGRSAGRDAEGGSGGVKRRRLDVLDGSAIKGSSDDSGAGHDLHHGGRSEGRNSGVEREADRGIGDKRKSTSSWALFIPQQIRAFFSK